MGTIFKYNDVLFQCKNLKKKLKKMRIDINTISIIKDDIPDDTLEKEFVKLTTNKKIENDEEDPQGNLRFFYWKPSNNYTTGCGYTDDYNSLSKDFFKKFGENPDDWILIKGIPIYPIEIDEDGLPKVEKYENK